MSSNDAVTRARRTTRRASCEASRDGERAATPRASASLGHADRTEASA